MNKQIFIEKKEETSFKRFNLWMNIWVFSLLVLLVKFLLIKYAQTVDADAVSRSLIASSWYEYPRFITDGMWAPFHFYLGGLALWIHNDINYSLKIVSIILSSSTLPPLFYFLKREFDAKKAFIGVLIFSLSPILFRISFMFLSEIPFLFFVVLSFNFFSKGIKLNSDLSFFNAGLFMTIASGFRYESWAIIFFLMISLIIRRDWKAFFVFGITASIFPVFWMIGNYFAFGNILYSFKAVEVLAPNDFEGVLRKLWSFPFILFIAIGPIFSFIFLKNLKISKSDFKNPWSLLFILFFILILYKSLSGTIIPHTRFIGLITLLSIPIILKDISLLEKNIKSPFRMFSVFCITIGLSYIYNFDAITPIPRLKNKSTAVLVEQLRPVSLKSESILIDFIDWETTYFLAIHLYDKNNNLIILNSEISEETKLEKYKSLVGNQLLILNKNHYQWIENLVEFDIIFESSEFIVIYNHD